MPDTSRNDDIATTADAVRINRRGIRTADVSVINYTTLFRYYTTLFRYYTTHFQITQLYLHSPKTGRYIQSCVIQDWNSALYRWHFEITRHFPGTRMMTSQPI